MCPQLALNANSIIYSHTLNWRNHAWLEKDHVERSLLADSGEGDVVSIQVEFPVVPLAEMPKALLLHNS